MKPRISFVLSVILIFVLGFSSAESAKHIFMWELSYKGSVKAYILGSIHAANETMYPLDDRIKDAFDRSSVLVVEVDIVKSLNEDFVKLTAEKGMYPPGESLKSDISSKLMDSVAAEADMYDLSPEMIMSMKPWFLATTIMQLKLMNLGFNPMLGIDLYFLNNARGKKKIVELETAESQLNILSSMDMKTQELFLEMTLEDESMYQEEMDKILFAWQEGDVSGVRDIMHKSFNEKKEFLPLYDKMILDRNKQLSEKIKSLVESSGKGILFIVVGAGHLVGPEGIINILGRRYKVKQI